MRSDLFRGMIAIAFLAVSLSAPAAPPKQNDGRAGSSDDQSASQPDSLRFPGHNVVFVSFDALQAAHVGALGYTRDVTPTIDRLAKTGFNFRRNTSVASWTVPASMTWFTGVYPSEHRMVNKYAVYEPPVKKLADLRELSPELVTLADVFRANGFATAGFTGNAGVSGGFGYEQGFDEYYYPQSRFGQMDESIPRAIRWLREHRDEKFFLFLHGYDVHGQSVPPGGFDYRFVEEGYDRSYTGVEREQELLREEGLDKGRLSLPAEDVRFWRAIYDEKIQRMDDLFANFLSEIERLGLMDETVFVLTSDHGTEFYEHRRFDHGFTLYQELIHVPLIIRVPRKAAGSKITDRVSSIDVMPTVIDLLQLEISPQVSHQLRGHSLVPAMRGEQVRRPVFSETDYREYTYKRSVITPDGWKLIYTLEDGTRELYDLSRDPLELHDLSAAEAERADRMQRLLFDHFKSIGHDLTAREWKTGLNPVYPSQAR